MASMVEAAAAVSVSAASRGEAPSAVGEGCDGLVPCPRRGDPALENVAASGPTMEKASNGNTVESTAAVDGVVQE